MTTLVLNDAEALFLNETVQVYCRRIAPRVTRFRARGGSRGRIRAARRRREGSGPFVLGNLAIDFDRHRVTVGGAPVELTATEFELLRVLALDAGRVVPHDALLRRAWNGKDSTNPNWRRKLGDDDANPT